MRIKGKRFDDIVGILIGVIFFGGLAWLFVYFGIVEPLGWGGLFAVIVAFTLGWLAGMSWERTKSK